MGDSSWPLKYGDYGAGNCNGCHGYPPLDAVRRNRARGIMQDALIDTTYGGYAGGGDAHNVPDHLAPTVRGDARLDALPEVPPLDTTHAQNPLQVQRANIQVTIAATYDDKAAAAAALDARRRPDGLLLHERELPRRRADAVLERRHDQHRRRSARSATSTRTFANRAAATQWNSAITGVHAVTTTVSGQNHSANAQATCGGALSCHLGVPTNHLGANLDDSAMVELTTATANLRAGITIATGPGHDPNADTCAVSCHREGSTWARLNDRTKATAPITDLVNVCATCHGTFAAGWVGGAGVLDRPNMTGVSGPAALTSGHASNWDGDANLDEVTGNHGTCKTCHGMNALADADTDYLTGTTVGAFWNPAGTVGYHGNGSIDMNGPSAAINAGEQRDAAGFRVQRQRRRHARDLGLRVHLGLPRRRGERQPQHGRLGDLAARSTRTTARATAPAATAAARRRREREELLAGRFERQRREPREAPPAAHDEAGAGALQRDPHPAADRQRQRHLERQAGRAVHATATPAPARTGTTARGEPAGRGQHVLHALAAQDAGQRRLGDGRRRDLRDGQLPQQQGDDEHGGDRLLWNGNTTTNTTACIMCHTDINERRQCDGADAPGARDDGDGRRERLLGLPRGGDVGHAGDGAGGGPHQRHVPGFRERGVHVQRFVPDGRHLRGQPLPQQRAEHDGSRRTRGARSWAAGRTAARSATARPRRR